MSDEPEDVTFACVLHGAWPQNAPSLGETYVRYLYEGIRKNVRGRPWRFVCFTDRDASDPRLEGIATRALPTGFNGWFNKLYLFAPEAFPAGHRIVSFDLDTVVVGDIEPLLGVDLSVPVFLWDEYS